MRLNGLVRSVTSPFTIGGAGGGVGFPGSHNRTKRNRRPGVPVRHGLIRRIGL